MPDSATQVNLRRSGRVAQQALDDAADKAKDALHKK